MKILNWLGLGKKAATPEPQLETEALSAYQTLFTADASSAPDAAHQQSGAPTNVPQATLEVASRPAPILAGALAAVTPAPRAPVAEGIVERSSRW